MVHCTERDSDLAVRDRRGDSREKETRFFLSAALSFPFLFFTFGVALKRTCSHTHLLYFLVLRSLWAMLPRGASRDWRFAGLKFIFSSDCWSLPYIL